MNKQLIIGLIGEIGAGKDTIANLLTYSPSHFPSFEHLSFAGPLKDACSAIYGVDRELFDNRFLKDDKIPYWNLSPREMAITVGTKCMRQEDPDHWIKRLKLKLIRDWDKDVEVDRNQYYTISDVRFQNEVDFIISEGGVIWRIIRPVNPLREIGRSIDKEKNLQNLTEMNELVIPPYRDFMIMNDGSKDALEIKTYRLLENVLKFYLTADIE